MRLPALLALLAAAAFPAPAAAQTPPAAAAEPHRHPRRTLLHQPGRPRARQASMVVRDGRIEAVQDGFVAGVGGRAPGRPFATASCCPGLIDSHVH